MTRLIVERRVAIKELWEVRDDWDPHTPLHLQGQLRSRDYGNLAPVTIREYQEGESLQPNLTHEAKLRGERGYWTRIMKYMKGRA